MALTKKENDTKDLHKYQFFKIFLFLKHQRKVKNKFFLYSQDEFYANFQKNPKRLKTNSRLNKKEHLEVTLLKVRRMFYLIIFFKRYN